MKTNSVNILIPLAGKGSRFVKAGVEIPKPLISVGGKTMIEWAMKSFNFLDKLPSYKIILVILKEHNENHDLGRHLRKLLGEKINIVIAKKPTKGQAQTCLLAENYIDNDDKLFIYNCDTYSVSDIWKMIKEEDPDGIIPCFKSNQSRYSYVRSNKSGYISEVAEKRVISSLATTGMYYFKRGADFIDAAKKMIARNNLENGEFYVVPCYNQLIKSGKKIKSILAKEIHIVGTPEELKKYLKDEKDKVHKKK